MKASKRPWRRAFVVGGLLTLLGLAVAQVAGVTRHAEASIFPTRRGHYGGHGPGDEHPACGPSGLQLSGEPGGTWYWVRSPDEERRVISGLYNRYCIRCHGVDGRGVWDIPDVPDFANAHWQASRSDAQLVRATLEGRGAIMPPFRGTLTLEEGWAMARYLRTFVPGTETPRPDRGTSPAPEKKTAPDASK
jgi:mono/diheme cytochrome c family protein